jgi:hypothetical protein
MLTLQVQEPVEILDYAQWNEDNPQFGEFVRVKVPGEEQTRRYSLHKDVNGDRAEIGTLAYLTLDSRLVADAYNDSTGKARPTTKEKYRVIGFTPAKAA